MNPAIAVEVFLLHQKRVPFRTSLDSTSQRSNERREIVYPLLFDPALHSRIEAATHDDGAFAR